MVVTPRKLGLYCFYELKVKVKFLRNVHTLQRKEVHKKGAKEIIIFHDVMFEAFNCF